MRVGKKLKKLRRLRGLTLQALAEKTGLSVSYLSNVERDATSPTLQHMDCICRALGVLISDFLSEEPGGCSCVHKDEFEEVFCLRSSVRYELALCGEPAYKCVRITVGEGGQECSPGLPEDNMVLVTEGEFTLEVNGECHRLSAGDIAFVKMSVPHIYGNPGKEPSISYWFALSPTE